MNWSVVHRKNESRKKKKVPGERREITLGVVSRGISNIPIDGMGWQEMTRYPERTMEKIAQRRKQLK